MSPRWCSEKWRGGRRVLQWLGRATGVPRHYRYDLVRDPDPVALVSQPGTGLGLLRSRTGCSRSPSRDAARHAAPPNRRPRCSLLTKANSPLDRAPARSLGLRRGQALRRRRGRDREHRFINLFTSSTYSQSVTPDPGAAARVDGTVQYHGLPATSHSGRDASCSSVRPILAAAASTPRFPIAWSVLQIHQRRRAWLFTRHDRYGRYVSALGVLPRDRYNTDVASGSNL